MPKSINTNLIFDLYNNRTPVNEIVRKTGYSKTTILKHLKQSGLWENRSPEIDYEEIINRYIDQKQSMKKIAREMNISINTVAAHLHKNNIETRDNSKKIDSKEIVQLYNEGFLIKDIVAITGFSAYAISKHLKDSGVLVNNHIVLSGLNQDKIAEFYKESQSLIKTAAEFDISQYLVKKILIDSGFLRDNFRTKNWNKVNDKKLVNWYNKGLSAKEIGDKLGYCHTTILKHLGRLNVVKRKGGSKTYQLIPPSQIKNIKKGAKSRQIKYDVSTKYLEKLFLLQEEKCALSGVQISFAKNYTEFSTGIGTASLDRIDSSKGYIKGNVQWVHKKVNIMKQDMTDEEFINWCKTIADCNS